MRKVLIVWLLIIIGMAGTLVPAHAQFGFGIFGATEVTQLLNHAELVTQYIQEGQHLAEALKQTADMLRNSHLLPAQVFGPIVADINALAAIVQGGQALAYSSATLDSVFQSRFPGYAYRPGAHYADYQNWSQTSLDTTRSTLRAVGLQSQQLQNEQSVLNAVRSMAESSGGRMEALQVANQIAEQQVQQLMKLRSLMLADIQSKSAYQAQQVQQQTSTEAAVQQFFRYSRQSSSGNTFQAGWN
jgi:P-type conjugative transfer protein TrbJ